MNHESNNSEVPATSELLRRFREESFVFRRARVKLDFPQSLDVANGLEPPGWPLNATSQTKFVNQENGYHVKEFLRFGHGEFIEAGYRGILRRAPDSEGLRHAMQFLERGGSKVRFLGGLRYSNEGKANRVRVTGLRWRYVVEQAFRVPVLGYVFETMVAIARLRVMIRRHRALEFYAGAQAASITSLTQRLDVANGHLRSDLRTLAASVAKYERSVEAKVGSLASRFGIAESNVDSLSRQIGEMATEQVQSQAALKGQIDAVASALSADKLRWTQEIDRIKRTGARADAMASEMDPFYIALEDRFRGTREEIRSRVAEYIPLFDNLKVVSAHAVVLDLGCGRGEWLEVLREHGLPARGVDLNAISVANCRERGLLVDQMDALEFLRMQPDESVGAITSLHMVEHLPFQIMYQILAECRRVLKTGGILILETPNPGNVTVGSNSFYLDPTHRNPIPSRLLSFIVEFVGLGDVTVMDLHRWNPTWPTDRSEMDNYLIENLFGAHDYAVVGYKQ